MMRQYELVERVLNYDPTANEALLNRAYVYAMCAHGNQNRVETGLKQVVQVIHTLVQAQIHAQIHNILHFSFNDVRG